MNWRAGDDTLLFSQHRQGFKSGGFNTGGFLGAPEELAPYDSETVTLYEAGLKTTRLDGRLRCNFTAFYGDYQDFQAFTPNLLPAGAASSPASPMPAAPRCGGSRQSWPPCPPPILKCNWG